MLVDFSPLIKNKNFRWLFILMFLTRSAGPIYLVALPYQIYHITGSTLWVGLLSLSELVPLIGMGLLGGVLADKCDRRKLILVSGLISAVVSVLLVWNALVLHPSVLALFLLAFVMSLSSFLARPAVTELTQAIVDKSDFKAVSALTSFSFNITAIGGPALTGLMISYWGFGFAYGLNFLIFVMMSLIALCIRFSHKVEKKAENLGTLESMKQGLKYAMSREEIFASYIVDMVAMIFGMPNALFPALAQHLGGTSVVGFLYAAPAVGALVISLFSGWTAKIKSYGKGLVISAVLWGVFIIGLGLTHNLLLSILALALAGAADAMNMIFRKTLWNEIVPNSIRGRLAGIEMITYVGGPTLGNAEAGLVASLFGVTASVLSGGVFCVVGVALCAKYFPKLWAYQSELE